MPFKRFVLLFYRCSGQGHYGLCRIFSAITLVFSTTMIICVVGCLYGSEFYWFTLHIFQQLSPVLSSFVRLPRFLIFTAEAFPKGGGGKGGCEYLILGSVYNQVSFPVGCFVTTLPCSHWSNFSNERNPICPPLFHSRLGQKSKKAP